MIPFALLWLSLSISPRFPPRIFMSLSFEWPNTHWSSLIWDTVLTQHHLLFQAKQLFFSNLKQFIWLFLGLACCVQLMPQIISFCVRGATQCNRPHPDIKRVAIEGTRQQLPPRIHNVLLQAKPQRLLGSISIFRWVHLHRTSKDYNPRCYRIAFVQKMMTNFCFKAKCNAWLCLRPSIVCLISD